MSENKKRMVGSRYFKSKESNIKRSETMKKRWKEGIKRDNSNFGIKTKELWQNLEYKKKMSEAHKGQKAWNKGLTKEDERVRKYTESPIIHHINGNHFDNRPENLMITNRREHINIHRSRGDLKRKC